MPSPAPPHHYGKFAEGVYRLHKAIEADPIYVPAYAW
jgi:hypothetical protein